MTLVAVALIALPLLAQTPQIPPGNTGMVGAIYHLEDARLTAYAAETTQTGDLNGDGDLDDSVPYLRFLESGTDLTLPYTGIPAPFFVDFRDVPVRIFEGGQQTDLNGDGDLLDGVLHIHDLRTGALESLGVSTRNYRVTDELVVMRVSESDEADTDLNGDGDTDDEVLHVQNRETGLTTNTGLATRPFNTLHVGPRYVVFLVPEADQGGVDLDGNGSADDHVLHVFDSRSGLTRNIGMADVGKPGDWVLADDRLVVQVREEALGTDVDSDGLLQSNVVSLLDPGTGTVQPTDVTWGPFFGPDFMVAAGRYAFTTVPETDSVTAPCFLQRIDGLTGDTLVLDVYLGTLNETGVFPADGTRGAPRVRESTTDLNGDGDLDDLVLHLVDTVTGSVQNLGVAAKPEDLVDDILSFRVSEASQGNVDRNGDGDVIDETLSILDLVTGKQVPLPLAVFGSKVSRRLVVCVVFEGAQGNTDINGDGDTVDLMLHAYDLRQGTLTVLGAVFNVEVAAIDGPWISYLVLESSAGLDLSGDGDTSDSVIHVTKL